jgi:hypothetical protein
VTHRERPKKRAPGAGAPGAGQGASSAGEAGAGAPFDPSALPDDASAERDAEGRRRRMRDAPAPGSPLPDDEVERLKEEAARTPPPPSAVRGQSDPAAREQPD